MDGSHEVSGKFVIASCDAPEIHEPAKTAFDNIAPFVGAFAEAVEEPIPVTRAHRTANRIDQLAIRPLTSSNEAECRINAPADSAVSQ